VLANGSLPLNGSLEESMRHAVSKSQPLPPQPETPESARAIPTVIAADLLEKLIADRDARAVDRVVTAARRH
jgi:hypothetical protein